MPAIWIFITALSVAVGAFAVYLVKQQEKQTNKKD